jgi:hypothetical protein
VNVLGQLVAYVFDERLKLDLKGGDGDDYICWFIARISDSYSARVDRLWHERILVVRSQGSAESGLVEFSHVKARIDSEALCGHERFEERGKVDRWRVFETALFTAEQEPAAEGEIMDQRLAPFLCYTVLRDNIHDYTLKL